MATTDRRIQVMFPQGFIDLQKELLHDEHLVLRKLLEKFNSDDLELKLAQIASYCEIILDGVYTEQELNKLCEVLTARLQSKRTKIIF